MFDGNDDIRWLATVANDRSGSSLPHGGGGCQGGVVPLVIIDSLQVWNGGRFGRDEMGHSPRILFL